MSVWTTDVAQLVPDIADNRSTAMHNEFTAVIERDGDWFIAYCPEVPGANGQGHTLEECRKSLADAIALLLEERRQDSMRGVPAEAIREVVTVE